MSRRTAFSLDTTSFFLQAFPCKPAERHPSKTVNRIRAETGESLGRQRKRGLGMLKLELRTKKSPEYVGRKLKSFFGQGGLGLELKEETPACLTFEGGGGHVSASICEEGDETRVDLVTQEWDFQVKEFSSRLG
jgi:hypothetical protein